MALKKRTLAIGLAALAAAVGLFVWPRSVTPPLSSADGAPQLYVRKNIDDLTKGGNATELNNLRHAFQVLMKRSRANLQDQSGYIHWARIHNHPSVGFCVHASDRFLPWHRIHLAEFEKVLRSADPDHPETPTRHVTIPYWDWTAASSGRYGYPAIVEEATVGGVANSLYWPNKTVCDTLPIAKCKTNRMMHRRGQVPHAKSLVDNLIRAPWKVFGGNEGIVGVFESSAHNEMHDDYIGSAMNHFTSAAYDPLFWFFHANVDRLMQTWQQRHQRSPCAPNHPNPLSSLDDEIRDVGGKWPPASMTVAKIVCIDTMGYKYDRLHEVPDVDPNLSQDVSDFAPIPSPREGGRIARGGTSVRLAFTFAVPAAPITLAYLQVPKVTAPSDGGYRLRAYLHPVEVPYRGQEAAFADRYYAGQTTVWALGGQANQPPGANQTQATYSIDVGTKLNQIIRAAPGQTWMASVVITRLGNPPAASPVAADAQPSIVVIGPAPATIPLTKPAAP